ncbi:unnamed protein product, partial [Sphacelaria rigidula]
RQRGSIVVRYVLDFGAHFTSLPVQMVEMLERQLPGVPLRIPLSLGARQAVTASGQHVSVTERTVPLQLAFKTAWGLASLPPISFAIIPGSNGVVLLGLPTLQDLGVDPYERLKDSIKTRISRPVERGPDMFIDPAEEESARKVALEKSVTGAVAKGLSVSKAELLRDILHCRVNAFRRALRGDFPARVELMRIQLKPGASAAKTKPRRYDPVNSSWL